MYIAVTEEFDTVDVRAARQSLHNLIGTSYLERHMNSQGSID
jgi:hypothetical protein